MPCDSRKPLHSALPVYARGQLKHPSAHQCDPSAPRIPLNMRPAICLPWLWLWRLAFPAFPVFFSAFLPARKPIKGRKLSGMALGKLHCRWLFLPAANCPLPANKWVSKVCRRRLQLLLRSGTHRRLGQDPSPCRNKST